MELVISCFGFKCRSMMIGNCRYLQMMLRHRGGRLRRLFSLFIQEFLQIFLRPPSMLLPAAPLSFLRMVFGNFNGQERASTPANSASVCPVSFRVVLAELVPDRLLHLQPRPHPLLQGVLRPPLPGRLCFGVRRLPPAHRTRHCTNTLAQAERKRETRGRWTVPAL